MIRSSVLVGVFCALVALLATQAAYAAQEENTIVSHTLGSAKVHQLVEKSGMWDGPKVESLLKGVPAEVMQQFIPKGQYPSTMSAYLIQVNGKNILVDAGFSENVMVERLHTLGVQPENVDVLLLTHMHIDHIGAMLQAGKVAFPKAAVFVAEQEVAFWRNDAIMNSVPEEVKPYFVAARRVLDAYTPVLRTFSPATFAEGPKDVVPGIKAVAAFGHTPGHTMYLLESEGKNFLIWGDLVHALSVQMPHPEAFLVFDTDGPTAVASRKTVLDYVAQHNIPVGGMHLPLPGFGTIAKQGQGFAFTPLP
ncbi:MBL fold metallo-hydrolase [Desulfovibrio cuneatus]|uniref:MBL fold metallo-hydrolase n=1 Tax=Desulfovibrio cuneatus TaxID=159728 RepID=UPI0004004A8B|nr:MBL fold metallo-hydrolase [Desulfovibrio cuneatus]